LLAKTARLTREEQLWRALYRVVLRIINALGPEEAIRLLERAQERVREVYLDEPDRGL